jgi:glyoxylase-like metal-dependent hydrolase (beta-lactamase superfamily II)
VIVERVEHPTWTSNAYLVAEGQTGVLIDSNGEEDPILRLVEESGIEITHVLTTHLDADHVVRIDELGERFGVPVLRTYDGSTIRSGGHLEIQPIATPGHAVEHWALLVNGTDCFTGDCLFKGTVGGTGNGGPDGYRNQVDSIMNKLLKLPPETRIHPGHTLPSRIGEEWEQNPFVRIWRGVDPEGDEPCRVRGQDATLILFGPDYDGTHKAWVRYPDGRDAIVGGSQIERS